MPARSHRHSTIPDALERRRLFSLTFTQPVAGELYVTGDDTGQNIQMRQVNGRLRFSENGVEAPLEFSNVQKVTIDALGGNDTVTIDAASVSPSLPIVINGGHGNDTLRGGTGNDLIFGRWGNDLIEGFAGNDTLYGDDGDDVINGGNHGDYIYGGNDNDTITGNAGFDYLYGNAGDDRINSVDGGDDFISGGDGNDTANREDPNIPGPGLPRDHDDGTIEIFV